MIIVFGFEQHQILRSNCRFTTKTFIGDLHGEWTVTEVDPQNIL